jgi:hypothetical protein
VIFHFVFERLLGCLIIMVIFTATAIAAKLGLAQVRPTLAKYRRGVWYFNVYMFGNVTQQDSRRLPSCNHGMWAGGAGK